MRELAGEDVGSLHFLVVAAFGDNGFRAIHISSDCGLSLLLLAAAFFFGVELLSAVFLPDT
jgi:hypothetical protein